MSRVTIQTALDFADDPPDEKVLREIQATVGAAINAALLASGLEAVDLPPERWVGVVLDETGRVLLPRCEACGREMSWDPRMEWWHCPHDEDRDDDIAGEMGEAVP